MIRDTIISSNQESNLQISPTATIFSISNGSLALTMSSINARDKAYAQDPECKLILEFLEDPSKITNTSFQSVHHKLRQPIH